MLFDAYGTLVELDDFYGRLQRGFAHYGAHLSEEVVREAAHAEIKYYVARALRGRDYDSWLILLRECAEVMGDAAREHGGHFDLSTEVLMEILREAIRFRVFPETREALEELQARGVPMGVLSNWDYHLPQLFEEIGLKRFFHFVESSSQIGYEKPAPQVFARGLELASAVVPQLAPEQCLYVGDHYEKDAQGARAAGMRPVWIVREVRDLTSGDTPVDESVTTIRSLREILPLIEDNS